MEPEDELMFDIDVDLEADDKAGPGPSASRYSSHKPRFSPCLAKAKAYTRVVDDSIDDTHLQHGLKRHPSTQSWKS